MELVGTEHSLLRMKLKMRDRHDNVFNEEPPAEFMTKARDEEYSKHCAATSRYMDNEADTKKLRQTIHNTIQLGGGNTIDKDVEQWRMFLLGARVKFPKTRGGEAQADWVKIQPIMLGRNTEQGITKRKAMTKNISRSILRNEAESGVARRHGPPHIRAHVDSPNEAKSWFEDIHMSARAQGSSPEPCAVPRASTAT